MLFPILRLQPTLHLSLKRARLLIARHLFDKVPARDATIFTSFPATDPASYASAVSGFAKNGHVREALQLFRHANALGLAPSKFTLCTILNCCSKDADLELGWQVHARMVRDGHDGNLFLMSALLDLYSKCGAVVDARGVFDGMKEHDIVSWSAIISGLAQNGQGKEALILFKRMLESGTAPNCVTLVSAISGCTGEGLSLDQGNILHTQVIKRGLDLNSYVISSLIDFYAKCGGVDLGMVLFRTVAVKDAIVYNSMIAGFSQNFKGEEALELFHEMWTNKINPTSYTFATLFNACGCLAALHLGEQVHALATKTVSNENVYVSCALIDMYSKCGHVGEARGVFDHVGARNNILWTSMIMCYAQHGRGGDGVKLFEEFLEKGLKPDNICFTAVLTACNHSGLVDKGAYYLNLMKNKYGLSPELDQYACLIDLYGRTGHLQNAKRLIQEMPFEANAVIWSSFLASCREYREVELGREAADHLFKLEPGNGASYLTLASTYNKAGLWEEAAEMRKLMKRSGLGKKRAGCSKIEFV